MARSKDAKGVKSAKSKGKEKKEPETADDILAAGVEFEEAGEKWRSGDTAKSSRFFVRAFEAYATGLHRFPESFDLAYNRARLFFELIQQPRHLQYIRSSGLTLPSIGGALPASLVEMLHSALYFHQYALELEPENADAIFNLAQIHASLGEAFLEDTSTPDPETSAVYNLEKAVDSFEKCFTIQKSRYLAVEDLAESYPHDEPEIPSLQEDAASEEASRLNEDTQMESEEHWASIETPVTATTLLDTCIAELEALTAMVPLVRGDQTKLQSISAKVTEVIISAETYALKAQDSPSILEFSRAKAKADASLLIASFRLSYIGAKECAQQVDASYEFARRDTDAEALSESAEARIEFHLACASKMDTRDISAAELQDRLHLQWRQLSTALAHLSAAAKMQGLPNVWLLHSRKADTELYRCRLAEDPYHYEQAVSNKETLLKNAEVFYRGAKNLATMADEKEFALDMAQRERIVQRLRGQDVGEAPSAETVREMMEEGLLGQT